MAYIQKRGDSYRIKVSNGYDVNGKQILSTMTYKPDKGMTPKQIEKEVKRQAVLFEERIISGQFIDSKIKLADFSELWFKDYAEKQLKPKTIAQYKALSLRVLEGIGHIRLDRLQPTHIIKLYNELEKEGIRKDTKYSCKLDLKDYLKKCKSSKAELARVTGLSVATIDSAAKGLNISAKSAKSIATALNIPLLDLFNEHDKGALSGHTVRHCHIYLSSMLHTAVEWQIIASNPCDRVPPPKVKSTEPQILDDKLITELLSKLDNEELKYQVIIKMFIQLGFRRAEMLGLEWSDIDFDNNLINVKQNVLYLPDRGIYIDDTKTSKSKRIIKAPENIMLLLKEYKIKQAAFTLQLGDYRKKSNFIFTKTDGLPMHPDSLTGWFAKFLKRSDLPKVTLHSLRHTNASLLISHNVPITTVAKRLGHANAATTAKIYAHAIQTADEAAAEELNAIFTSKRA